MPKVVSRRILRKRNIKLAIITLQLLIDQDLGGVNAEYTFTTINGIFYSVSFTDVSLIIDTFDNYPILSNGIYLVIEPINKPEGILKFDSRIGITICEIYEHYLRNTDLNSIIIYNCEERDGDQLKRHLKFSRWFVNYVKFIEIEKIDKEILVPEQHPERGMIFIPCPLSILFSKEHPRYNLIFEEIALAIKSINNGKPDIEIL